MKQYFFLVFVTRSRNEDKKILKEEESIEILKMLGLIMDVFPFLHLLL